MNNQSFLQILIDESNDYKKQSKQYKVAISKGDLPAMLVVTEVIQECLKDSKNQKPTTMLNAVRFGLETVKQRDSYECSGLYIDMVAERILPLLAQVARFRKESTEEDRGKLIFSNYPSEKAGIYGNSYLHIVLECIMVWGNRFAGSVYSETFAQLVEDGVTFPKQLYYFKDDADKVALQTYLRGKNHNLPQQPKNVNEIQNERDFGMTLNPILDQFAHFKNSLLRLLDTKQSLHLNQLSNSAQVIQDFSNDFKALVDKALTFDSSQTMENHLNSLFIEEDFCTAFLNDYKQCSHESISIQDIQRKYVSLLKKQASVEGNNTAVAAIGGTPSGHGGQQPNNHHQVVPAPIDEVDDEEERKDSENSSPRKPVNNNNNETPTPHVATMGISSKNGVENSQLKSNMINVMIDDTQGTGTERTNSQYTKNSQYSSISQRSSFKEALSSQDMEKYKLEMRSGASFRKQSSSPSSHASLNTSISGRSAIIKKSQNSSIYNSKASTVSEEMLNLKKQVQELTNERNYWKDKCTVYQNQLEEVLNNQQQQQNNNQGRFNDNQHQ